MSNQTPDISPQRGELLVYQAKNGTVKLEVRLENESLWLSQQQMAELFQTSKQNIGQHLKNIFSEEELHPDSVVKNFFTTAADGKNYETNFYKFEARRRGLKEAEGETEYMRLLEEIATGSLHRNLHNQERTI